MLARRVRETLDQHEIAPERLQAVVGVSGGVDSIVLLHVLVRLGADVEAVHVNYGLRGEAAASDERFVAETCQALGVPVRTFAQDPTPLSKAEGTSLQAAARDIRYRVFEEAATEASRHFVAVGHNADDRAESVLLHLFRGTGIEGLAGMPFRRPLGTNGIEVIRPILHVTRDNILSYARNHGLSWCEDASNLDTRFRRNAVRTEIRPVVESHFGSAAFANVAHAAETVSRYLLADWRAEMERRFCEVALETADGGALRLKPLGEQPDVWVGRIALEALHRWLPAASRSSAAAHRIVELTRRQTGRMAVFEGGSVVRERDRLVFVRSEQCGNGTLAESGDLSPGTYVRIRAGTVRCDLLAAKPTELNPGTTRIAFVDATRIDWPLKIRPWEPGDAIVPLGLGHHKKVSDLLTDAKIPTRGRRHQVVAVSNGDIVWVVGHRLSSAFRVLPETGSVAMMTFIPAES